MPARGSLTILKHRAEISFPVGAGLSLRKGSFDNAADARVHKHQARCAPGYPTQTGIGWGGTLEKDGVSREAEPGADEEESADREQEVFGYGIHWRKIVWKSAGSSNILSLSLLPSSDGRARRKFSVRESGACEYSEICQTRKHGLLDPFRLLIPKVESYQVLPLIQLCGRLLAIRPDGWLPIR